ncbi:MAG: TonB-dependent receptor [Gemmatimonadales bacterium]|nr:MAG: TonB-dependent receptor [Gemmatimonadales bacterium]
MPQRFPRFSPPGFLLSGALVGGVVLSAVAPAPVNAVGGPTGSMGAPPAITVPSATISADTIPADTLPVDTIQRDTLDPIPVRGVIVNILRSPIRVDRAPFAISVIQEEVLGRGRSASSVEEALHGLPGVQVQNRFNDALGEQVSIRGFGARSGFGVRGIQVVVDGIPATLPDGQSTLEHLDLGSLGRVEALRGPGAALYGNAAGGVLTFETRAPSESRVRQELRVVEGDHGMHRLQSTTSGTLGAQQYLVSLSRYEWDGFRTYRGDGNRSVYGNTRREQVNATFSSSLLGGEIRLVANHLELGSENPGALTRFEMEVGDRRASSGNVAQGTRKDVVQSQAGLTWRGPLAGRELELATHAVRRELVNPIPWAVVDLDRKVGGIRGILRTEQAGPVGDLWWAAGFEASSQLDERRQFANEAGERGSLRLDQRERVFGGAVFIQALLPINRVLDVMTGLRYDRIRFSAADRLPRTFGAPEEAGGRTLDSASPSFGLHASITRALGAYMNLSTAFETPTTSELANHPDGLGGFNPELEPQVGITGELGARGLLGEVAAWELAFFHTVLYNELVPFEVAQVPGRRFFRNSGRSEREGIEATLQFSPDPMVAARMTLSTNRAHFRSYSVDGVSYSGNRVPGIAPHRIEGILRLGPGSWFAEFRGEAMASILTRDDNDPQAATPPRRLLDVRAGVNEANLLGLRLSPFLGITNVLDVAYTSSVSVNAVDGRYFEPGPGRAMYFGASLAVQY